MKVDKIIKGYADSRDEKYVSQAEGRLKTFQKCLDIVEKYAPKRGRILDVGCAAGFFLKIAKERGWQTDGVEPSKWLANWGNKKYGLKIRTGTFRNAKFFSNHFDAVTMWDVLEHTPDPSAEIREAYRVLKKDGLLVVNFPNIGSKLAKIAGSRWWFLLSVHLWYFTPDTLTKMLEKNGFRVMRIKRHFQQLSLGYLVFRVKPYSKLLYKFLDAFVNAFGLQNIQVNYYASQSVVLARKV